MNTNRPRNRCLKNGLQLWARTKSVEPKYSKSSAFPCPTVAQKPQRNAKAMQHKLVHREKKIVTILMKVTFSTVAVAFATFSEKPQKNMN